MAKKYYLVSTSKFNRNPDREELQDFTKGEFEQYEKDKLPEDTINEFQGIAAESQGFEWWIEEIED